MRLAAIVESSTDAIIGKSLDGTIESWNAGAENLYGYSAAEAIGQQISILLPKGSEDELPTLMARIKVGERISNYETVRVKKDGQYADVALTISPILDGERKVIGAATIARDITKQKQADAVLRTLSNMEATAQLAGGVAHDLNNLMAAVMGNAELLALEFQDRTGAMESVDAILTSAQMAGRLAQELLAFARGGRHESAVVNLNNIVMQVRRMQLKTLPPRIKLEEKLEPNLRSVEADTTQMSQVLHNLLLNAIEALDGKGEILVTTSNVELSAETVAGLHGLKPGPHVVLSVGDNGCGMSPEVASNIFKPFFSTKGLGRGLGLAAVYGIVKNHDGYVSAESQAGPGACFKVYFPATARKAENIPQSLIEAPRGKETILVVDDDAQILMINKRILEAHGYHVLTAREGAEALRVSQEFGGDIHLVVLDMAMPVMDGAKAFTLLKEARPSCKVIISSGYDLNDSARSLLVSGADAFLQKPFRLTDLTAEVRRLLDLQKSSNKTAI